MYALGRFGGGFGPDSPVAGQGSLLLSHLLNSVCDLTFAPCAAADDIREILEQLGVSSGTLDSQLDINRYMVKMAIV
jgi:hypothetical protein